jgi:hypothetical protein
MKRLSIGAAIACAIFAFAFFNNLARSAVDEAGSTYTGSGGQQQALECGGWARFAGSLITLRYKGVSQDHLLLVIHQIGNVPDEAEPKLKSVVAEAYRWPTDPERLQAFVHAQCMKGWPESHSDAGPALDEFRQRVRESLRNAHQEFERDVWPVKSQQWYCDAVGAVAESMDSGFRSSEFTIEQIVNEHQKRIAELAVFCRRANEPIRKCAVRRCMERPT